MIRIQDTVYKALEAAAPSVYYAYPQDWTQLPALSFYEISNSCKARAGGYEHSQEVAYQVDTWATSPEQNWALHEAIDAAMVGLGFIREISGDTYETETRLHHRTARYRAVVDVEDGTIHQ